MRESTSLGLTTLKKKLDNETLHFVYAFSEETKSRSGSIAYDFLFKELPQHLARFQEIAAKSPSGMRIVIDSLTPLMFEIAELKDQRDHLNRIFHSLRKIGTSVITLEQGFGKQLVQIPMFLADSIIELDYIGLGSSINRTLRIRKFRGSSHSERPQPIDFVKGSGLNVYSLKKK